MPGLIRISLDKVHDDRILNYRVKKRDDIGNLSKSVKAHGEIRHVCVSAAGDGTYDVRAGFGLFEALKSRKVAESMFVDVTGQKYAALAMAENNARADCHWAETASGALRAKEESPEASGVELAAMCGMSAPNLSKLMAIAESEYLPRCLERLAKGQPLPTREAMSEFLQIDWAKWATEMKEATGKPAPTPSFTDWCDSKDLTMNFWAIPAKEDADADDDVDGAGDGSGGRGGGGAVLNAKKLDALYALAKKAYNAVKKDTCEDPERRGYMQGLFEAFGFATRVRGSIDLEGAAEVVTPAKRGPKEGKAAKGKKAKEGAAKAA